MATRKRRKTGLPPGSVVYTGSKTEEQVQVHYTAYDEHQLIEETSSSWSMDRLHEPDIALVQWYDLRGLHDTALIERMGQVFHIHPLALEDIADATQRPGVHVYDDGVLVSVRTIDFDLDRQELLTEQVSCFLGQGYLLSFQERAEDLFAPIRRRIQQSGGRVRKRQTDYLLFILLDYIADRYFLVLDDIEITIESLEERIVQRVDSSIRLEINSLRQELGKLRRSVQPFRDLLTQFARMESDLIEERTEPYFRDLHGQLLQLSDLVESYRDNLNSLQDLMHAELGAKTNSVMQLLTIVSTIFIPITFLAGIYGMNFAYMPELQWRYAYPVFWLVVLLIIASMVVYFRRKGWL